MAYEIGKKYEFKRSEFDVSKEYGRVCFIIPNPASATPFRVKPFEFQANKIPDKLICVYRGNDRFEQDQNSVVPELYTVGQEYRFRVMRQDSSGAYSLRDDVNGLTFFPVDLGTKRFKRFERVVCRVLSTDEGWLKLEPVSNRESTRRGFTFDDLMAMPQARPFARLKIGRDIAGVPILAEAVRMLENGDSNWAVTALQIIATNVPQWLAKAPERRAPWLQRLIDVAVGLIESSDYITRFPPEQRYFCRRQLSELVRGFEDYQRACALIAAGTDEAAVKNTLATLRNSGWLYEPERKMRLMMAIFTLRNNYAHTYIGEIFSIIRNRHDDEGFMHLFKRGFITMLSIYIANESKLLDPQNRQGLRDLIMALATELLLTVDLEYELWNHHRGLLYTCAIMLLRRPDSSLPRKALECYADRYDWPLEFAWRDLDDINLLCYNRLLTPMPASATDTGEVSVFDGDKASLVVGPRGLSLVPAITSRTTKTALAYPVFDNFPVNVQLNARLSEKIATDASPELQHPMWVEAEHMLFDPDKYAPGKKSAEKPKPVNVKSFPAEGDEVTIRIVRQDSEIIHLFYCEITDDFHIGRGTITTRDIVAYPVKAFVSTFQKDGKPLLLKAKVVETDGEGNCKFSMRSAITALAATMAREDRDSGEEIPAIITEDGPDKFWAVSNYGYPVMVYKNGHYDGMDIRNNDAVYLNIIKVSYFPKTDGLFINGRIESIDEERRREDNYRYVESCLQYILEEHAKGLTYDGPATDDEAAADDDDALLADDAQRIYMLPGSPSAISQLLNVMVAAGNEGNLGRDYSLLQLSRLIAETGGDLYRASFLEAKTDLLEALAKFAANGRLDPSTVESVEKRCRRFADDDGDLALRLTVINLLGCLEQPMPSTQLLELATAIDAVGAPQNTVAAKLARMVLSYNMLRGLKLNATRTQIVNGIYDLLNLPRPSQVDTNRLNVREDQHHEFKQSMIFPADNKMLPDEKRQAREIMEVICGMLNTRDGGTIYLGVNNLGVPVGLHDDFVYLNSGFADYDPVDIEDKFSLAFTHWIRTFLGVTQEGVAIYPDLVTLQYDDMADKRIALVTVRPFPGMAQMTDGAVFVRQESSTVPIKSKREQAAFAKLRQQS